MKKKESSQHTFFNYILAGLLIVVGLIIIHGYFYVTVVRSPEENKSDQVQYERHYALIPEQSGSIIWNDIYRSAQEEAREHNDYLEWFADWSPEQYSVLDYFEIAIASNVDGIIIRADGSAKMREAIQKANDAGISVITVLNDDTQSARRSFVGPNNYQMGMVYGQAIAQAIQKDTRKILVVQRHDLVGKELIFKELKAEVQAELSQEQYEKLTIDSMQLISGNDFDAEEIICDILTDEEERPDLLVCMNPSDSESAYHAMIDYNLVGKMDMIGYYNTDTMITAISKGTISSAVTVDTDQIGKYCIEALDEYYDMGYVSNYFSIDLNVIEKSNSKEYLISNKELDGEKDGTDNEG